MPVPLQGTAGCDPDTVSMPGVGTLVPASIPATPMVGAPPPSALAPTLGCPGRCMMGVAHLPRAYTYAVFSSLPSAEGLYTPAGRTRSEPGRGVEGRRVVTAGGHLEQRQPQGLIAALLFCLQKQQDGGAQACCSCRLHAHGPAPCRRTVGRPGGAAEEGVDALVRKQRVRGGLGASVCLLSAQGPLAQRVRAVQVLGSLASGQQVLGHLALAPRRRRLERIHPAVRGWGGVGVYPPSRSRQVKQGAPEKSASAGAVGDMPRYPVRACPQRLCPVAPSRSAALSAQATRCSGGHPLPWAPLPLRTGTFGPRSVWPRTAAPGPRPRPAQSACG